MPPATQGRTSGWVSSSVAEPSSGSAEGVEEEGSLGEGDAADEDGGVTTRRTASGRETSSSGERIPSDDA